MTNYATNQFKNGLKILLDGDPCNILDVDFVKPGKGQAFTRIKYRNLSTGRTLEKTFKSGESVEGADVMELDLEYLYNDGEFWHFMDSSNYEQHSADANVVAEASKWLKENDTCTVTLWNGALISVTPSNFVILKVTQTDPGLKGDTATGGNKPATLETGTEVRVPLFVEEGDLLKIDTRIGEYVSRAKE